jgi:hypothetical protein
MVAARIWSLCVGRPSCAARIQQRVDVPLVERADLDRQAARDRGEPGLLQGRVQVGGADDPEPAELFLDLRVWHARNQEVPAGKGVTLTRISADQMR